MSSASAQDSWSLRILQLASGPETISARTALIYSIIVDRWCGEFEYARLRAGSRRWWSEQLRSPTDPDGVRMALLIFATWAGVKTVEELAEEFDRLIDRLEAPQWRSLYSSLRTAVEVNSGRPWVKPLGIRVSALPSSLSVRTVALLAERCTPATRAELYERYLTDYEGEDSIVFALRADVEVRRALADEMKWPQAVESLRLSYRLGAPPSRALFRLHGRARTLPEVIAREIVEQPLEFPSALVQVAEAHCRQLDAARILPVGRVAIEEGWFAD